jgi:hypothetical protein
MKPSVDTFDPRLGQEYAITDFETKRRFSNLGERLFVACAVGVDWSAKAILLRQALVQTSRLGSIAVEPWRPHARQVLADVALDCARVERHAESAIAYFELRVDVIQRAFALRSLHGGQNSGTWCVGGCLAEFGPPKPSSRWRSVIWDFALLLGQPERIGLALALDEMQQSTLMTRILDGFDEWRDQLRLGD